MIFRFKRYRDGVRMAQEIEITKAGSFDEACEMAAKRAPKNDVLVLERIDYRDVSEPNQ